MKWRTMKKEWGSYKTVGKFRTKKEAISCAKRYKNHPHVSGTKIIKEK